MNKEIISLLDKVITNCSGRDNIPSNEMMDMLLDIRILINKEMEKAK